MSRNGPPPPPSIVIHDTLEWYRRGTWRNRIKWAISPGWRDIAFIDAQHQGRMQASFNRLFDANRYGLWGRRA